MSEELIVSILKAAITLAVDLIGRDRTRAILDAEYAAADAFVNAAEREKLGS